MVSRTAQYVALYRALETDERARRPLFVDPLARRFLPRSLDLAVRFARLPGARRALLRYADHRAPGARTSAIARTALLDDVVRDAVAGGVEQLVVLGAGFDCRAQRMPELAAAGTRVFEVDRAETQAFKRARLGRPAGRETDGIAPTWVAVDFLRDDVAAELARAGWRADRRTLVLWEGVTNYLTEAAVQHVLAWVGSTAPRSSIAFTYVHHDVIDHPARFAGGAAIVDNVRRLGEPWTFGLRPDEVGPFVARAGLRLREDLGADDYRRRYLGPAPCPGYAFYRLAIADVAGVADVAGGQPPQ